jgi:protein gp37
MDIFDDEVKVEWLADALQVVNDCKDLDFLLVTKRPELWSARMTDVVAWENEFRGRTAFADFWLRGKAPANVWMITSTENQEMLEKREPELLKIPAVVHGLSCEPLLGPLVLQGPLNGEFKLYLRDLSDTDSDRKGKKRIDWVIAGGESGPSARPMDVQWMVDIQKQCTQAGVAYFGKQLGAIPVTENANLHDWPDGTRMTFQYGYPQAAGGRALLKNKKGEDPAEWPEEMRIRQWPNPRDSIASGSGGPGSPIAKASSAPSSTEDR